LTEKDNIEDAYRNNYSDFRQRRIPTRKEVMLSHLRNYLGKKDTFPFDVTLIQNRMDKIEILVYLPFQCFEKHTKPIQYEYHLMTFSQLALTQLM